MGVPGLVVAGQVGLDETGNQGIIDPDALGCVPQLSCGTGHNEFKGIEQSPAVSTTGAEQGLPFGDIHTVGLQPFVLVECPLHQCLQLLPPECLEDIDLAA